MKKFSLEEYLKNPVRKVVTKSGDEVTIIYTKAKKEWPVVAMINSSIDQGLVWQFSADGESMPDSDGSVYYGGLFFADEEEPLTEFEKAVATCMFPTVNIFECKTTVAEVKHHAKILLELAFKSPELDAAKDLVDAVERYVEPKPGQEFVHRSEVLNAKNRLKELLK